MSNSRTELVKNIIMEYMEGKDVVDRKDIVKAIRDNSEGAGVSEGVIAGSFKILITQGYLYPVSRGVYQRTSESYTPGVYKRTTVMAESSVFDRIYRVVKRFNRDIDRVCTFNVLELSEDQRGRYAQVTDNIAYLRGSVKICVDELDKLLNSDDNKEVSPEVAFETERLKENTGFSSFAEILAAEEERETPVEENGTTEEGSVEHDETSETLDGAENGGGLLDETGDVEKPVDEAVQVENEGSEGDEKALEVPVEEPEQQVEELVEAEPVSDFEETVEAEAEQVEEETAPVEEETAPVEEETEPVDEQSEPVEEAEPVDDIVYEPIDEPVYESVEETMTSSKANKRNKRSKNRR